MPKKEKKPRMPGFLDAIDILRRYLTTEKDDDAEEVLNELREYRRELFAAAWEKLNAKSQNT
jgi:hypothetical protein